MIYIVCKDDKEQCPYYKTCLARIFDRTITGCGLPLYIDGAIKSYNDIVIVRKIKGERNE